MNLDPALTSEELDHLVLMATYAPSVHNTQPWLFRAVPQGLLLLQDRTHGLDIIDPSHRELLLSCGTAVHHLVVAARAIGIDADVDLLPASVADGAIALFRLSRGEPATESEIAAAVTILHRHTHRGRFADDAVPTAVLDRLQTVTEQQQAILTLVRADDLVDVEVLLSRAEQSLLGTPGYTDELARWVWHGSQPAERGDGLPPAAVDHGVGRAESLIGRQFDGETLPRPDEPPVSEHPTVAVLSTDGDTPADWVQAGRALSAVLLAATEHGVLAQPMGQVIDVESTRAALKTALGLLGAPQMLLRLGLGSSQPVTPRRPVREFLTHGTPSPPR